ncbi:MAG: hypothetical protein LBH98_08930 [Chitinispirillales bacterium]|jgi:hypothetical protein|nr:hypothetical protein [Chitinispirillales bacterium]
MLKLSFKIQLSLIAVTVAVIVAIVVYLVNSINKQVQFMQTKALQTADYGFQAVTESAMPPETFSFTIDSLKNTSGTTPDGGKYSVSVTKDTISLDSIEVKIESCGSFGKEVHYQSKRLLLVSPDSVNWVMSY